MPQPRDGGALTGKRILVAEDRYLLADDMCRVIAACAGEPVGPVATLPEALELVRTERLDAALLDVDLRGEQVFALADMLEARGVPFLFITGFERSALPKAHRHARYIPKPLSAEVLGRELNALLAPGRSTKAN